MIGHALDRCHDDGSSCGLHQDANILSLKLTDVVALTWLHTIESHPTVDASTVSLRHQGGGSPICNSVRDELVRPPERFDGAMTPSTWLQLLFCVVVVVVLIVLKSPAALQDAHLDRSPVFVRIQAARPMWVKTAQGELPGDHDRMNASVASERPSWPGSPIPAHIHQMWIDDKPPCGYDNGIPRWVIANPNFSHTLWTHATSDRFVQVEYGDDTWRVYDLLYAGAYRADLFR